ncbi:hypothetical protein [Stenotrophomonas sp. 278]|uniref:5' nucleotidase, NT5C type n=1 Tax=Stenotrophomonas sp. 278 TaxID=2479851 RepID=UPI000F66F7BF|nr:hypothetical protein [Stenotrophomonas sp. 278]RRU13192.1 hypothetical protein EGJ34_11495 [Stenotrophomonas sp. 278]
MEHETRDWTGPRKAALVVEILQGRTSMASASAEAGISASTLSQWVEHGMRGLEQAFQSNESALPSSAPRHAVAADTRTLYLDLDGVMADFDTGFPAVFGLDHRQLEDDVMWGHINGHASFFRDLPPIAGAIEFFRAIEHLDPVILTACPKSNYTVAATQKRAWVREHLSQTCLVLPVLGGANKPLFMHRAGDVLVDDWSANCAAWNAAGGVAVKHSGDWSATYDGLVVAGVL